MKSKDHELHPDSPNRVEIMGPTFARCTHDWQRGGIVSAHWPPVADGTLVLVRKGKAVGAFIPLAQWMRPESVHFRYWFRADGQSVLVPDAAEVDSGEATYDATIDPTGRMTFGPFAIRWSGASDGEGFIYYDYGHPDAVPEDGLQICITSLTNMQPIDVSNDSWAFHGAPRR
jgi:hypothetical protein